MASLVLQPPVFKDGFAEVVALVPFANATAGDTIDVGVWFSVVLGAALLATAGPVAGNAAVAVVSGTVITMPAGPNKTAGYLLVFGERA